MKQIRVLAQYYVDLMVKLGLVRFSLLLASALVVLAMVVQMAVTMLLRGEVESIDVVRSIFFGLLITPWAVYFLSVVVEQLEESRQRLARLVDKLEEMRHRDLELNQQLKDNISQLNREIADRIKAEEERLQVMEKLTEEMEQRELAQIELGQQSALLRSFLDASPDLVYYRNEDKEFSGCNRAMELLTGKSEKQLIGLTPFDVYGREIAEKVIETDEKVFRHNVSLTYEQWLVYPDGRKACFELRKVPFYDRVGKRHGLMGFGRDITERKRYGRAGERQQEKTTFISTISHELRTPLNGIVGLSRILLDTELNDEQLKYLKTIHVSAITLGNIFNDIIEMDKLERRKVQLDNQPVDFTGFGGSGEPLRPVGAAERAAVHHGAADAAAAADRDRRYAPAADFVEPDRQRGEIHPAGENRGARAARGAGGEAGVRGGRLGHGHPAGRAGQDLRHVLPVKDQRGGRPATGTGIGLAVSKRLAQSMGGDITVRSEQGHGSCFTLTIRAPAVQEAASAAPEEEELPLPALHILLVEDIELNVIVARSVLEKLGNSVEVAMNGHDALAMFDPNEFDLVLLDIQLPDMTGLDIARALRERYAGQALPPLVALTANVLKDKKSTSRRAWTMC